MTTWPEDHPGRNCGVCGRRVYAFWVERNAPPPGTCPEGHTEARACGEVMSHLLLSRLMTSVKDGAWPTDSARQLLERSGLTVEGVVAEEAFRAEVDTASRALAFETPIRIGEKSVAEWLSERADPRARFVALIGQFPELLSLADGKRTIIELGDMHEDVYRRCVRALEVLRNPEYDGEPDDGGGEA